MPIPRMSEALWFLRDLAASPSTKGYEGLPACGGNAR